MGLPVVFHQGVPIQMEPSEVLQIIGPFTWCYFFIFLLFTCWSFSGYASSIGTIRGTSGEVDFPKICARNINAYLCEFTSLTNRVTGAGF